jgi:hypothetical protein
LTFTLSAALFVVALIFFILAAVVPFPEPYGGRLIPAGLAFMAAAFLAAAVAVP